MTSCGPCNGIKAAASQNHRTQQICMLQPQRDLPDFLIHHEMLWQKMMLHLEVLWVSIWRVLQCCQQRDDKCECLAGAGCRLDDGIRPSTNHLGSSPLHLCVHMHAHSRLHTTFVLHAYALRVIAIMHVDMHARQRHVHQS